MTGAVKIHIAAEQVFSTNNGGSGDEINISASHQY